MTLIICKVKPGTLTAGIVNNNFKYLMERFLAGENAFSVINSVKITPVYWKQFSYGELPTD